MDGAVIPEDFPMAHLANPSLAAALPNSRVENEYRRRTPGSAKLYAEACEVIPAGLTHDSRTLIPFPVYVSRAAGPRKWDVDGNEYVDYFGGHGALLLGHSHPSIVAAVQEQVALGTHWGASHELEVRWAELVQRLIPCAQRVRFTASGTEASHLALRLARAFTGKPKVLRFVGHFHGWHDQVAAGAMSHFDGSVPAGIPPSVVEQSLLLAADDVAGAVRTIEERDDIAAIILEPSGASWGMVPLPADLLTALRAVAKRRQVLLIFDEVITGFRWSRGGAQERYGITPDMCVLAKILAGGLPGGAVAGRKDIMDQLDQAAAKSAGREKIGHQGTFNSNPLCAAAAVATLSIVETEDVCARAEASAQQIRRGMRQILVEEDVPWGIYGEASAFLIFQNPGKLDIDPADFDARRLGFAGIKGARDVSLSHRLRIAMLSNGVDIMGAPGGLVSASHGPAEVAQTLDAFRTSVRWLKEEGDIAA
jgi:glutamate-1-semialdehyde 2,1-aminomutase